MITSALAFQINCKIVKNMDTVLVTGGAGYIGSHTCKALAKAGLIPVCFDNLSTGHRASVKWGPFVQGDIRDEKALDLAFTKYKPIGVLHFAAKAYVVESVQDPGKYYENNVTGSLKLLQAMVKHDVKNIVFSSTCATYGNPTTRTINESHPQKPINPYGKSKLMVEEILQDFEKAHGIRHINLRYFNAAGDDFDLETGEDHFPETHIIPSLIETALGLRDKIQIFGTDFPTKDGTAVRDYIHVYDLASAHIKALKHLKQTPNSENINLGTGKGFSILEIIAMVEKISQKPLTKDFKEQRAGEPALLIADITKAKEILSWEPVYSDLQTIITSAYSWHKFLLESKKHALC